MRKLAVYSIVVFGLVVTHSISNLVFGLGYEEGNSIIGLVVSVPMLMFCFLFFMGENKKTKIISKLLWHLGFLNIAIIGFIIIEGIYDIVFGHNYGIGIIAVGLITVIPMLILCNRYLWNEVTKKVMDRPSIRLEREIEGFQLDAKIDMFENNPVWKEIKEPMKRMFESGLSAESNEKLFRSFSDNKDIMLGFAFDKLYKIGIMLPSSKMKYYLQYCNEKYGKGREDRFAYTWQDNNTKLELIKRQPNPITGETLITIFLTDRNLLKEAYR